MWHVLYKISFNLKSIYLIKKLKKSLVMFKEEINKLFEINLINNFLILIESIFKF